MSKSIQVAKVSFHLLSLVFLNTSDVCGYLTKPCKKAVFGYMHDDATKSIKETCKPYLVEPAMSGKAPDCISSLFLNRSDGEFCNDNYEEATGFFELLLFPEAVAMEPAVGVLPRRCLAYQRVGQRYVEAVGMEDGGGRG